MKNSHQIGQATVEALCAASIVVILLTASATMAYLVYAKHVASFSMEKSLLCLETVNMKKSNCEKTLRSNIRKLLFFHSLTSIKIRRQSSTNSVILNLNFFKRKHRLSKKLNKQSKDI